MKKLLLVLLLSFGVNAFGMSASCQGHDSFGQNVNLNVSNDTLSINGETRSIAFINSHEIRTLSYVNIKGEYVYDSIRPATYKSDLMLYQINASTGKTLVTVYLTCTVWNTKIFNNFKL